MSSLFATLLLLASPPPAVGEQIGVNIHFTGAPARDLDLIGAAGFGWVRMDFAWEAVERRKGEYDFKAYDELVDGLAARRLRALFILDYSNRLYEEERSVRSAAGREAFARFAAAAAGRYRGRGARWEIWNEPNLEQFWQPQPAADDYALLVAEAARAIRAADPEAWILAPASSGFPWKFLERLFELGLLEHVDAVSVHPYRGQAPETVEGDYERLRALIAGRAPGGKEPPAILSGEWGYSNVHWGQAIGAERQAAYLARQFLTNIASGIELSIWYDWANDGPDPKNTEHNFGTVTESREPKPAYRAAKALSGVLGRAAFVERLRGAAGDHVLVFSEGGGEGASGTNKYRLAAWTEEEAHEITLLAPGLDGKISAVGLTGETSTLDAPGGALLLHVDGAPCYLELPGGVDPALLGLHGIEVVPYSSRLGLKLRRSGAGKEEGVVRIRIGEQRLERRVELEAGGESELEIEATWPEKEPARVEVRLEDAKGRLLAGAAPRAYAAVPALEDWGDSVPGFVKHLSVALDGDSKTTGGALLFPVELADGRKAPPGAPPGSRVLGCNYHFAKGWKFIRIVPQTHLAIPGRPAALSLWVAGDGSGSRLRCRYQDARGETFQPEGMPLGWEGWRRVTLPLDGREASHWGGNNDGEVNYPIRWDSALLIDSTREESGGVIQFANPVLVYTKD